ncbi:MAG: hypothetical protein LBI82_12270 [Dysgonamonadaceae bacterium]|jgi:hypothetical protein|nr:hypothetical protein [Dysgonamonadaceae bacterium]
MANKNLEIVPDILNSKIKKLQIELPHYSFSHSSSEESHTFVGRKQVQKKLKKLIEATDDKTGVYLVTGNRGVGKTSLVNQVINQTSLQQHTNFSKNLTYLFFLLFAVAGTQFLTGIDIVKENQIWSSLFFFVLGIITFVFLCKYNSYRRKNPEQKYWDYYTSAIEELSFLTNPHNPYRTTQYLLKIILIICYTQIISVIPNITSTKAFVFYLCFVFAFMFWRFIKSKLYEYYSKYKKEKLQEIMEHNTQCQNKIWKYVPLIILLLLPIAFNFLDLLWCYPLIFVAVVFIAGFWNHKYLNKYLLRKIFYETVLIPIWDYIKSYNRLYLRINFGHKLKDEKDILRLIARTLSTEYNKYHRSFRHMLLWRVTAFGFLFLFSLFFIKPILETNIQNYPLYQTKFTHQVVSDTTCQYQTSCKHDTITAKKIFLPQSDMAGRILLSTGSVISKTKTYICYIPEYLWDKNSKLDDFDNQKIESLNYTPLLSFLIMYLFFTLLFRTRWFTAWFATHGIIKRQLKKLNNDITHSTERENGLNINYNKFGINTRTKKTRGVADAREIEKELQDILNDIQRIPIFMCRPNFVIVFDELDKVEPSETGLEKETQNTKASLFSINATREKQHEILKILSNMKYFLSTVNAKFIFIAGREMYDIYLADVSDRNNHIGSIFNTVIYVPSFLTDHADTAHEDMTSLTEEFVCRKLIPHDYPVESYNLASYREYLYDEIYIGLRQKEKELDEEKNTLKNLKERKDELEKNKKDLEDVAKKIQQTERVIQQTEGTIQQTHKIIAVLQHLIIYLAHVSKGAPKKMMQLFESFIEVSEIGGSNKIEKFLIVQRYHSSRLFLTFDYYKQYTLGITAYLITPIFNRLSESNIKEHSDKLLVSSLRFVDFLFKFHKHNFSWKHLDISPEMLEVNRSPELKSVAVDLLNYLTQIHINKSNFSLNDYKFDSLIANEIFVMTKTDEVFSALYSFSLDETLPLKEHYKELLEKTWKEYSKNENSTGFNDAISSLQVVLGDLHYYDDELEEAEMYYKNVIQSLRDLESKKNKGNERTDDETMSLEQLYLFVRNMLKLGMIYEKRKQYDFAYLTYGELCKRIIWERNIAIKELSAGIVLRVLKEGEDKDENFVFVKAATTFFKEEDEEDKRVNKENKKYCDNIEVRPIEQLAEKKVDESIATPRPLYFKNISPNTNDMLFKKMTFEGLKQLYLPFIAKLQILEKSHVGGITHNHLKQLDREFKFLTSVIHHEEAKLLEAEFFSRVADILYYKNSDLKCKMRQDEGEVKSINAAFYVDCEYACIDDWETVGWYFGKQKNNKFPKNCSCTACDYYCKALSTLLNEKEDTNPLDLLGKDIEDIVGNYNMKYCTVLARILSDWGNVFYSCDNKEEKEYCYICKKYLKSTTNSNDFFNKCVQYIQSKKENCKSFSSEIKQLNTKKDIAFAMYSISLKAYTKANLYKRSAYQIYKMLHLFKSYENYENINMLGQEAIRSLWYAAEELFVFELNKRKKDFDKKTHKETIPLQNLLVDSEISRIRILVKNLELKSNKASEKLKIYYDLYITSPYGINYSISARIYQLRLKTMVNYETYKIFKNIAVRELISSDIYKAHKSDVKKYPIYFVLLFILREKEVWEKAEKILGNYFDFDNHKQKTMFLILEKLIAETIFCFNEIIRLTKTVGETYLFSHSFMGSIHDKLSYWIRGYETYKVLKNDINIGRINEELIELFVTNETEIKSLKDIILNSQIDKYLENYLGEEWEEELSGYYENQQALSHYYKCLEMHNEGRAYHNMIDSMCYIKDDYNDRSDHFNIAAERHYILNGKIYKTIDKLEKHFKNSKLHEVDNYFSK